MKNIFSLLKFADIFTLLNAVFGLTSIYFSIMGQFNPAAVFMLLAVLFDYIDGKMARFTGTSEFGRELDSLADIISFGISPIVFGFSQIKTTFAMIVFALFLICGILRLARHNIIKIKGFVGMPITMNGIIIPVIYFANVPVNYYPYIFLASAILMISSIKIRKVI